MSDQSEPDNSYEVPINIIESPPDPDPIPEVEDIDDQYAIVCPVCGHDEFEDIFIRAKKRIRWARKYDWNIRLMVSSPNPMFV